MTNPQEELQRITTKVTDVLESALDREQADVTVTYVVRLHGGEK